MNILHLEDDPHDATLVRELLCSEWAECDIVVVATAPAFRAELERGGYDLVLSDFTLPQFNGLEALALVRQHSPTLPFIFVSGNIGEDRAIEVVRAGADDYVLKSHAKRLIATIPRALHARSEHKRLMQIEHERERLAAILENTPDFVGLASPAGETLYLNRAARHLLAFGDTPVPSNFNLWESFATEVGGRRIDDTLKLAERDGNWSGESVLKARDGRIIPVSQALISHRDERGQVEYFSTVMRDLTTRKQSEALVNGQNQILEMIAGGEPLDETLLALVHFVEAQSDDLICSILLLDEDGQHLRHCTAPRLPAPFIAAIDGVAIGPNVGSCGTAVYRRSAVIVEDIATDRLWDDWRAAAQPHGLRACWSFPIFDVRHRMLGTFAAYRKQPGPPSEYHRRLIDVGTHVAAICLSRNETERQIRDQADILNKASDAIIVTDFNHRITFWNQSAERTFGWTAGEALGRLDRDLLGPDAAAEISGQQQVANKREEWRGELKLHDRHGRLLIMDSRITVIRDESGRPQGRLSISTDVTEKKRIEEQFFRAQRLESIGMLSAGIAHDLNNVLAPILLAAPMLRDHATDPSDLRMISTLEKSAERGAALVRQILGFAQGADGEHRLIQAKHLLRDVASFIEETFPKSIRFQTEIPSDLWTVKANPTQLHQVLLNLCVNARDAMPEGGTLLLRAENCVLDEAAAGQIEGSRPGAFLVLHVEDTGTGIPPDVLTHMWEPFFTTKGTGKGTGLGLSTVRGIVENHAGFVTVFSRAGKGTTFRIYLEAVESGAERATGQIAHDAAPRGSGELVLVVDDEANIRNMAAAILTRHGYRVLAAADGAEAVALFAPRTSEISLVITDLSMPNLDGAALAGVIHRLNSEVKIVAVSGLSTSELGQPERPPFIHAFLVKPFRPDALLRTVHSLLPRDKKPEAR